MPKSTPINESRSSGSAEITMVEARRSADTIALPRRSLPVYAAVGGTIVSDFPFEDLSIVGEVDADVRVERYDGPFPTLGELIRDIPSDTSDTNDFVLRAYEDDQGLQWVIPRVGRFWVSADGRLIRHQLRNDAPHADAESYLVGPVLGVAAQQRGNVLLHAAAAVTEHGAIAFTGPSGFGKSTLAASFLAAGFPLLSDDVLPVRQASSGYEALRYLPKLKLWDDSLEMLGFEADRYDRVLSWIEKRRVQPQQLCATDAPPSLPLRTLYFLAPHLRPDDPPQIEELDRLTACLELNASMYMAEILTGRRAASALPFSAALPATIQVRRVSYFRDPATLPALRDVMIAGSAPAETSS